ncbi:ribonuclease III [Roseobacter sp. HKCCD9010]|uniref:ribonuclease III n=1 Tax=Rhodobacterales TaxID=204455 RepID=UPI0014932334|nr:ribonuclease III [Fontisubflavum oceani]MBF9050848.1 ribonuclease III [Rhodobacterales bacterium HKCCD4356]NNV12617.1 ribonuclease III [Roseobacter sp. HKCCD7357]NNV16561.1 ribonuclease III [Roseobacter sp. HKCCD8768]NNV26807.1 ribonuclease III [Roseobacter sp. HKCCD8192]NNV30280.1 ribonuclease III [Roseobacter sp. HKCCD9061]NNV34883.1 ribonuclease III [Roseobacter sp. HKCCD9073]NNV39585.1 ribonuclease III [Roseobacter sp. HKCCD9054]NNV43089.1 ribonuclease III [Roseobacter sp. HKCCD6497]
MKLSKDLSAFCDRLGHVFDDPALLIRALTHSSLSTETRPDNQRLEFLGDRVLGLVMAEAVLAQDPTAPEGTLAPRFNALVRKETCADVAREIDLGAVLKLGKSEQMTGGRRKNALLGDAMEAVIAAVYEDAGFDAARALVLRLWGDRVAEVDADARDAKTALQEWAQARGQTPPSYVEIGRSGPDHAPVFTIEARLQSGESARAEARAKRQAEQAAAAALMSRMGAS